jgi:hypothetical protein
MTLHLKKSTYRYNVIAKQEAGASERCVDDTTLRLAGHGSVRK